MQEEAYRLMAELEREHWWYRGRRAIVRRSLAKLGIPESARLLDVGAGTGGNLPLLAEHGDVIGLEPSPVARALGTWQGRLVPGLAGELPFRAGSFDVVTALDVVEHLHDEIEAFDEIHRVLRPGGFVVLFVPAYQFLWGDEDVISNHLRRYRRPEIRRLLEATGFEPLHLGYALTLLFPVIAAAKIAKRLLVTGPPKSDVDRLPPAIINSALTALLAAEAEVTATAELPFGASIIATARRI